MSTISWLTQEDFLRDLDNYAEYTRPKIDEHGEVVCDTPVPDTLRRFFTGDEISSKEKLKTKEMDSDKDVDESSFEKRDEPKADSASKKASVVVPKYQKQQQQRQQEEENEEYEARGFVPQRIAYWQGGAYGPSHSQPARTASTANVRKPKQRNQRGRGRGGANKHQNKTVFMPAGMALSYSHF